MAWCLLTCKRQCCRTTHLACMLHELLSPMRRSGRSGRGTNMIVPRTPSQQQLAQIQKNQQMQMLQQLQREQPDMDMGGHRPQSPGSADNAPSPSKRPRLEGAVNGQQLAPNGRGPGQGIPGQPNQQMMMQNGMQRGLTPAQFQQYSQQPVHSLHWRRS